MGGCGELIVECMVVTSIHGSRTTSGYRLELANPRKDLYLTANIFEGAQAFERLFNVKKGNPYLVVGQLPVNTRILNVLDIHS